MEQKNLLVAPQCSFSETPESLGLHMPNELTGFMQLFLTHGNNAESEAVFHKLSVGNSRAAQGLVGLSCSVLRCISGTLTCLL